MCPLMGDPKFSPDPKRRAFTQQREKYAAIIMDEMLDTYQFSGEKRIEP